MWYSIAMFFARILYKIFRGTLKKAIDNPKRDWDERAMAATDAFFNWKKPNQRASPEGVPAFEDRGEEITK